jgi:hypothetical protein
VGVAPGCLWERQPCPPRHPRSSTLGVQPVILVQAPPFGSGEVSPAAPRVSPPAPATPTPVLDLPAAPDPIPPTALDPAPFPLGQRRAATSGPAPCPVNPRPTDRCQKEKRDVGPALSKAHFRPSCTRQFKWVWKPVSAHSSFLGFPACPADLRHCPRSRSPSALRPRLPPWTAAESCATPGSAPSPRCRRPTGSTNSPSAATRSTMTTAAGGNARGLALHRGAARNPATMKTTGASRLDLAWLMVRRARNPTAFATTRPWPPRDTSRRQRSIGPHPLHCPLFQP